MKTFEAHNVDESEIELKKHEDLEEVYSLIEDETNFIITYEEEGKKISKIIISNNICSKMKSGQLILKSRED